MGFHEKRTEGASPEATPASPGVAIDLEHLQRYTLGNRSLQEEVLALFRSQSELYLQQLRDACDQKAWTDAAHTLKGSARSVGAVEVARRAEAAEQLAGDPGSEDHRDAERELAVLVGRANCCIADILGNQTPDA